MPGDLCATCRYCAAVMTAGNRAIKHCGFDAEDGIQIVSDPVPRCDAYERAESGAEPVHIVFPLQQQEKSEGKE